MKFIYLENN